MNQTEIDTIKLRSFNLISLFGLSQLSKDKSTNAEGY